MRLTVVGFGRQSFPSGGWSQKSFPPSLTLPYRCLGPASGPVICRAGRARSADGRGRVAAARSAMARRAGMMTTTCSVSAQSCAVTIPDIESRNAQRPVLVQGTERYVFQLAVSAASGGRPRNMRKELMQTHQQATDLAHSGQPDGRGSRPPPASPHFPFVTVSLSWRLPGA